MILRVKLPLISVALAAIASLIAIDAAVAQGTEDRSPSTINITNDSARGWLPSDHLKQDAIKTATDYFSLLDNAQYERAYGIMAEMNQRSVPLLQYTRQNQQFHEKSGGLKRRDILKITWTKDPAAAPSPGVYAAIDVASYFENIDRHCGYIVLYQKPAGGSFQVMRQESNFIDNDTAQKIERQQSRATLEAMWTKLAVNCPNYKSTDSLTSKP